MLLTDPSRPRNFLRACLLLGCDIFGRDFPDPFLRLRLRDFLVVIVVPCCLDCRVGFIAGYPKGITFCLPGHCLKLCRVNAELLCGESVRVGVETIRAR